MASTGDKTQSGFTHYGRFRHMADRQRMGMPKGFRMLQSGQGIGGFIGLGDHHYQLTRNGHWLRISVITGNFKAARHARQLLDPVTRRHAGMT